MNARAHDGTVRPPRRLRLVNRAMTRLLSRGAGPSFLRLLTVSGRQTGRRVTTPVVPVRSDGGLFVVAAYGAVSWVRNVRAAGRLELRRGQDTQTYAARELGPAEAVPVLRAYLAMPTARFVRSVFGVTATSPDEAIAAEAPRHPVFALTAPAGPEGRSRG